MVDAAATCSPARARTYYFSEEGGTYTDNYFVMGRRNSCRLVIFGDRSQFYMASEFYGTRYECGIGESLDYLTLSLEKGLRQVGSHRPPLTVCDVEPNETYYP